MRRKARERAARSSKTDARFTAKIIARTMKAARAEMRMRNGRRGHDQKRDQKRKVEREQGKQLKYCFPKNEICEIVSVPKTCLFLRQNRSNYGKYFLVQWSLHCFSFVNVCGLWIFIWPVSPVQGVSPLQIGRAESIYMEREKIISIGKCMLWDYFDCFTRIEKIVDSSVSFECNYLLFEIIFNVI